MTKPLRRRETRPKAVHSFRADQALMQQLRTLAADDGRTMSQYIERLIAAAVARAKRGAPAK